ncbi:site-specific integrase [Pseudonocardia yuanmonensis]|uniref:Site-specific integrase n=1 Tax=Pseudonocardia yuanmonensis TaxID=1095914 RepID=A0ABP8XR94_9PSEU
MRDHLSAALVSTGHDWAEGTVTTSDYNSCEAAGERTALGFPTGAPASGRLELAGEIPLTEEEAGYAAASRAANTLRDYRSDWTDFSTWCAAHELAPLPADPAALTGYLTELAARGHKVGTLSRRLSAIRFAHQLANHPDPGAGARVGAVWEGIRRTHGAPPEQAAPLMPPELFDVVAACPETRRWKTRAPEPDLAGLRDRALLLVGFFAALRRSELAALTIDQLTEHDHGSHRGLVLGIPRSKTNQTDAQRELVVLPRAHRPDRCPVTALQAWLDAAGISEGPVLRKVTKANRPTGRPLHPESVNKLLNAIARAGLGGGPWSAHSLRAGFVTYAHLRGASDRAIAHQTRHRSLASVGAYVRIHQAWENNAATLLGL